MINLPKAALIALVRGYQLVLSPVLTAVFGPLGFGCRFTPTCSQYALEALRTHGALRGSLLALRRLARCQPWGSSGHDPVPPSPDPADAPDRDPLRSVPDPLPR